MCGICGKLYFDRERPVDPDLLGRMMDSIAHRGPDGQGSHLRAPVGLGHRRLSIIDLDTGGQPMCNEDATVWVVFNGEIYNFRELRAQLERKGHRFSSASDTEVIVHLYEELGDDCVSRLNGMFAFALWDERRQRLLLARDRVGIKPLYFTCTGNAIVFGSEIKALLADPDVRRQLNLPAIDRFLTYHYLPGDETMFEGISKLPAGHCLTVEGDKMSVRQYWDLRVDEATGPRRFGDAVAQLQELLAASVKDHMISDVPVGVLLSGGIDSTAILGHAVEHSAAPMHTFTMGFSGNDFDDERPFAKLASRKFGTTHHEISMDADEFRQFLPQYVWHMEEPVCEPPAVGLFFVSRLARQCSVKVLLSGEGGDEAFGGYQDYRNLLLLESLKSAFGPAKGLLKLGFEALSCAGWKRGAHYAALSGLPLADYYFSRTASPTTPFNRLKSSLYSREFSAALQGRHADAPSRLLWDRVRHQSPLNQMLYVDSKTWLPDDLLLKADKMTMATSVELRVPLLDARILEFAASLPASYKVRGTDLKRVLKAALRAIVPKQILQRRKTGFPLPYEGWLRNELREFVSDTLTSSGSIGESCFSRDAYRRFVHEGGQGGSKEIFSLLVLELWSRRFLHERPIRQWTFEREQVAGEAATSQREAHLADPLPTPSLASAPPG